MQKMILDEQQVNEFIRGNRYKVDEENKFLSRCIDGRYGNSNDLSPLAIAGADAGQLSLIFAAANIFGFEVDREKVCESLVEVVGGEKNLRMHTDNHSQGLMGGCGYIQQVKTNPKGYNLEKEDVDFVSQKMEEAKKNGAQEAVLEGEHLEGAVVLVRGDWSLKTRHFFETTQGKVLSQIFIFQETLVNERHKVLVKKLLEKKALDTLKKDDKDYLYMILSETSEAHLFETIRKLAKGLTIFEVKFDESGDFDLKHLGEV